MKPGAAAVQGPFLPFALPPSRTMRNLGLYIARQIGSWRKLRLAQGLQIPPNRCDEEGDLAFFASVSHPSAVFRGSPPAQSRVKSPAAGISIPNLVEPLVEARKSASKAASDKNAPLRCRRC